MAGNGVIYVDDMMMATGAMSYGPGRKARDYIDQRVSRFMSATRDAPSEFLDGIKDRYKQIRSGETVRKVEALTQRLKAVWQYNEMRPLRSLNELRQAPPVMRRYVMANPKIRQMYHDGKCSGYAEAYVDDQPGKLGKEHYDFRRVTNELYYHDTVADTVEFNRHYESVDQEVTALMNFMAQASCISSWRTTNDHIETGSNLDPVSQWNGLL